MNFPNTIAILPLGAHEYHGPHLPLETDTLIAHAIAKRLQSLLTNVLEIRFLDVESVGYSIEHMRAKGTKTLSWHEAINRWIRIGAQQHQQGIQKLLILNAHGGNSALMTIVATELRARYNMLAVTTSWTRFGLPETLLSLQEQLLDIHAGFRETSLMLAIAPDQVNMDKAEDFYNQQRMLEDEFTHLRAYGKHAFGWMMHDINPQGAAGNARGANAKDGEKIISHVTKELIDLLRDIRDFNIQHLT
ncbi:MAG: creatinine amidohydrolase [Candidatus Tokpelaia sp. JSC161]|jgi:creatinine amidohydrolase|nr:MAG: creatinine amidohydrolase [Candidatus Tokpelaia sp. JSC161]